jgi:hypothetical protein
MFNKLDLIILNNQPIQVMESVGMTEPMGWNRNLGPGPDGGNLDNTNT